MKDPGNPTGRRAANGTFQADESKGYNVTYGERARGNRQSSLLARLARDNPTILDAYERGDYPSVRAAAKVAVVAGVAAAKAHPSKPHGNTEIPPGPGRGHRRENGVDMINSVLAPKGGTGQSSLLARLARDNPTILDAYAQGTYPSVRAAAKAAGIVKDKTPLAHLQHWWHKAETVRKLLTHGGDRKSEAFKENMVHFEKSTPCRK